HGSSLARAAAFPHWGIAHAHDYEDEDEDVHEHERQGERPARLRWRARPRSRARARTSSRLQPQDGPRPTPFRRGLEASHPDEQAVPEVALERPGEDAVRGRLDVV